MSPFEKRTPWNKGKAVGAKKPLNFDQVHQIRDYLHSRQKHRDLALFCCAFDTLLRGIDLLRIKVGDIQNQNGAIRTELTIRQQKTGRSILVALSPYTQSVVADWIKVAGLTTQNFLFVKKRSISSHPISTDTYRKLVKSWVKEALGLDPADYSSHSLRRTKATMVYEKTKNIEAVRHLLGHQALSSTSAYLNTSEREALRIAAEFHL